MKTSLQVIGSVLKKPVYALLAVVAASLLFLFMNLFSNLSLLWTSTESLQAKLSLLKSLIYGVFVSQPISSLVIQGVLVALIGVSTSLLTYRALLLSQFDVQAGSAGIGSILATFFSTGCSACGAGILSYLGVAGGLTVLPFRGKELWVAGILLVLFSMYHLSHSIDRPQCKIKKNQQ